MPNCSVHSSKVARRSSTLAQSDRGGFAGHALEVAVACPADPIVPPNGAWSASFELDANEAKCAWWESSPAL
eukprot:7853-Amphidinium_carterae.1